MTSSLALPTSTLEFAAAADGWAANCSTQARAMWAKSGDETGSLSLPQHLVDSACTAAAVFDIWLSPPVIKFLKDSLHLDQGELRSLLIWIAGTHDVGKACITFQTQLEGIKGSTYSHLISSLDDAGLCRTKPHQEELRKMPHGIVSGVIIKRWLIDRGMSGRSARALSSIADAHHGIASGTDDRKQISTIIADYPKSWIAVHDELLQSMAKLADAERALDKLAKTTPSAATLQILSGLTVMADWIASNSDAFPMLVSENQENRLIKGMLDTDLTEPWTPSEIPHNIDDFFQSSFDWPETYAARDVQRAMVETARHIHQPSLIILEAETGVGKTEAALAAAHELSMHNGAQGIYFAAPTMATANGLLERTIRWAQNSGQQESVSSLYLAHSKNQLSQPFQKLKFRGIDTDGTKGNSGSVVASSWMSGRRRGLLSNIVIGTMDQVLMLALQQRYSMLRHTALAGKIIIFDEVHAFDTYSSVYLERTLEWLNFYGASVIMMSATLPQERREALISAYTGELPASSEDSYPLITVATASDNGQTETRYVTPSPSPTNLTATIQVLDDTITALISSLEDLVSDGGCALVICNTIARAQAAYQQIEGIFPGEVELHHAGFIARDRAVREDALRCKLGPSARRGHDRPNRLIVVATQVAEQSLDIDADVLITDIAPIDLIIQRIGRLHRHDRPESDRPDALRTPQVFIRGVVSQSSAPEFDSGAVAIYGSKLLLSTFLHLPSSFRRPDDVSSLVQTVYGNEHTIPESWQELWNEALRDAEDRDRRAQVRAQTFRVPSPFGERHLEKLFGEFTQATVALGDEERGAAQVRDAEPTVEVIPIIESDHGYRAVGSDWEGSDEISPHGELSYRQAFALASSTVRLPSRLTRFDRDFEAVVSDLESSTPAHWQHHFLLRGQLALPLNDQGERQLGRFHVRYTSSLGFEYIIEHQK